MSKFMNTVLGYSPIETSNPFAFEATLYIERECAVVEATEAAYSNILEAVDVVTEGVVDKIKDGFKYIWGKIKQAAEWLKDKIMKAYNWLKGLFTKKKKEDEAKEKEAEKSSDVKAEDRSGKKPWEAANIKKNLIIDPYIEPKDITRVVKEIEDFVKTILNDVKDLSKDIMSQDSRLKVRMELAREKVDKTCDEIEKTFNPGKSRNFPADKADEILKDFKVCYDYANKVSYMAGQFENTLVKFMEDSFKAEKINGWDSEETRKQKNEATRTAPFSRSFIQKAANTYSMYVRKPIMTSMHKVTSYLSSVINRSATYTGASPESAKEFKLTVNTEKKEPATV